MMPERDRGSMLVLVVLVGLTITLAVSLALVPVLADLHDRQRARSAADAAALAGVTGGRPAAESLAAINGAVLTGWQWDGHTVSVHVGVGDQAAVASATDQP